MLSAIIVSSITAIAAIVSPIVTTILNNHHNYKLKKLDINNNHKAEAISDFIIKYQNLPCLDFDLMEANFNKSETDEEREIKAKLSYEFYASAAKLSLYCEKQETSNAIFECASKAISRKGRDISEVNMFKKCIELFKSENKLK